MIWSKITLEQNFFLQIMSSCMCMIETLKISSKSRKHFQLKNIPQHANTKKKKKKKKNLLTIWEAYLGNIPHILCLRKNLCGKTIYLSKKKYLGKKIKWSSM